MKEERFKRFLAGLLPALIVVSLGAGGTYLAIMTRKKPAQTPQKRHVPVVRVLRVKRQDIPSIITGWGTIRSSQVVPIAPEVSGRVVEVAPFLESGRFVTKGSLLFSIDREPYRIAYEKAKAEVSSLKSALEKLKVSLESDRERLPILEEYFSLAQKEYKRLSRLLKEENIGSESQVESAKRAALQAEDQLLALRKAIKAAQVQIKETEASLEASQKAAELAELNLKKTEVTAPISGRLKEVNVEEGQVVQKGQVLCLIENLNSLEIAIPIEGKDLLYLQHGSEPGLLKKVPAKVSWVQGEWTWEGRAERLERYDPRTRSAVVVVALNAPAVDGSPHPEVGMFCRVSFQGIQVKGVFRIPRDLVRSDGRVMVEQNGIIKFRKVEVVRWQNGFALIKSGLKPGDRVILTPVPRAVEGMEVKALDL